MAAKQPTSVSLSAEQRKEIEDARTRLARETGIMPSFGAIVRTALDRGLPQVGAEKKAG